MRVTVICKPYGRGNWKSTTFTIEGRLGQIDIQRGMRLDIGGIMWRVCEVRP